MDALRVEPRSRVYLFVKTNDCKIASVSCIYVSYFFGGGKGLLYILYTVYFYRTAVVSLYIVAMEDLLLQL